MHSLSLIVIFSSLIALSFATTLCSPGNVPCIGPVTYAYSDSKCSNLISGFPQAVFPSGSNPGSTGGACYSEGTGGSSSKWTCGKWLEYYSYTNDNCDGTPNSKQYYQTGTCIANSDLGTSYKLQCASASFTTVSALILLVFALLAMLLSA